MLNKNTIEAYHNITAPEGLQERIEAKMQAEQAAAVKNHWQKYVRVPAVTAFAAAAVCLAVWAGGADTYRSDADGGAAVMKLSGPQDGDAQNSLTGFSDQQGVQLMLENGEMLGESQTEITVYTGDATDLNIMLGRSYAVAEADAGSKVGETSSSNTMMQEKEPATDLAKGSETEAVMFIVTAAEPVTFKADGEILSKYDADKMLWSEPCSELVLETDGELCVLLTPMGDKEVFYIEMSSADKQSVIEIVHDKKAGHYMAACQTTVGE